MLRKLALLTALTASSTAFTAVPLNPQVRSASVIPALFAEDDATSTSVGAEAISALTANVKTVFSLEDIAKILPHRYPFLLVDKVVEYEEGKVRSKEKRLLCFLTLASLETDQSRHSQ
jgi:hypothetical protein